MLAQVIEDALVNVEELRIGSDKHICGGKGDMRSSLDHMLNYL